MLQLDFTGERLKVLQSNAESNHTEAELLRDKNTKFIASLARHQETISKLQEVVLFQCSVHSLLVADTDVYIYRRINL